jgi:hypothetical protein
MHFQAVLVLIDFLRHAFEVPFLLYLAHELSVYDEVADGRAVTVAFGCCGAGEVVVVRWAEQEDALAVDMVRRCCTVTRWYRMSYAFAQSALL